jgi:hypothetical protein
MYAFSHPDAVRRVPARPIARACSRQYFSMLEAAAVIVRHYELTSITERVPLAPQDYPAPRRAGALPTHAEAFLSGGGAAF